MAAAASRGGMLPEQVWDGPAIPSRRLQPGRATGSAMPLAWAHAEFVKLMRSRDLGRPFDRPQATWERYKGAAPSARIAFWWRHARIRQFATGSRVVVALPRPGTVRWGIDGWQAVAETSAEDTGLGFCAGHPGYLLVVERAASEFHDPLGQRRLDRGRFQSSSELTVV